MVLTDLLVRVFGSFNLRWQIIILAAATCIAAPPLLHKSRLLYISWKKKKEPPVPVSVTYFPSSHCCDGTCCSHVEKTFCMLTVEEAKQGLRKLADAGMMKINLAGEDVFRFPDFLGLICQYCREVLGLESVSIVTTNGMEFTEEWLNKYGFFVDFIAVSCDSFDEKTNNEIGRGSGSNIQQLCRIKAWCQEYRVGFKMNTFVCSLNWKEDMSVLIGELNPVRWKCFKARFVNGENHEQDGEGRGKMFDKFHITDEQFEAFCERHRHLGDRFTPKSNSVKAKSYLLLDEFMRFTDTGNGVGKTSESILNVSVAEALSQVGWDEESFKKRGGIFD
ncbi:hypothetical protein FQN54_009515 [Arachnomyces sp. PD_36]|nr:hypothetical protein FQN54_009515 [Arachnomyces sp. PD_36]